MASRNQPGPSYHVASARMDPSFPDFKNFSDKNFPKPPQMPNPSRVGECSTPQQQTERLATETGARFTRNREQATMQATFDPISKTWSSPLDNLVGKSDDVAVERLTWERMKKYYPFGPPRHMGRFMPIPDSWQTACPAKQSHTTMTAARMSPVELARYQANINKAFHSGARYFGMSDQEVVEDVNLRHIFAGYLADQGISRTEFDREYNRWAGASDSTHVAGPHRDMTVEDVKKLRPNEVAEPILTMAFRNLLLYRAEAALPDGHKTWRSNFVSDHPAIIPWMGGRQSEPESRPASRPGRYGAVGDGRKSKGKQPAVDTEDEDDEEGEGSNPYAAPKGERKGRKHLLGYAC